MSRARSPFRSHLALLGLVLVAPQPGRAQTALPAQEKSRTTYAVAVTEGGGLEAATLRTLRSLVLAELRRSGQGVDEDPALETVQSPGALAPATARGSRVLVLRVAGRLGSKVPLFLEEIDKNGTVVGSAALTAANLEECDIVIPRLVQALLGRRPVEETARMATVTESESRELRNKPGRSHFIMGIPVALFSGGGSDSGSSGLSLGWIHTTEHWNLGVELGGCSKGDTSIGFPIMVHAAWLPSDGPQSFYLGGGIGYIGAREKGVSFSNRIGFRVSAGMEFFRLHRMRLQAGVDVYFPQGGKDMHYESFYDSVTKTWSTRSERVDAGTAYPVLHVRVAF